MGRGEGAGVGICAAATATHRPPALFLFPSEQFHWCVVPESGQDVILFVGLAVVAACVLRGKLGTTMLLLAGAGWVDGRMGLWKRVGRRRDGERGRWWGGVRP